MRSRVPGRLSQRNLLTLLAAALLLVGFVVLPATSQQAYASPVRAETTGPVTTIVAGFGHSCALISGGAVKCWGHNYHGSLGIEDFGDKSTPQSVSGLSGATDLDVNWRYACALMPGGAAKCWGSNTNGQLGDGTRVNRSAPTSVVGLTGATALTLGATHACALMPGGAAKCWGDPVYGRLGTGDAPVTPETPTQVEGLTGATALVAGDNHTCALMPGGTAKCWGSQRSRSVGGWH